MSENFATDQSQFLPQRRLEFVEINIFLPVITELAEQERDMH
jgi:hypothetical protein